jgi:CRP/FNR family transcriptional regulator, cyclic AMP receptor protein
MTIHDALTYLPRTRVLGFSKRAIIYDHSRPPENLYLLLAGRVKISRTAEDGTQTLLRVIAPEGFFGETGLVMRPEASTESAVALEPVQAMMWSAAELAAQIQREPKLSLALFDYFGRCNCVRLDRVQAFMQCKTSVRVAIALAQIARAIGTPNPNGGIRVIGLTHRSIGEYVGTTREIVTVEMNNLRRLGFLEYSRRYTDVYVDALAEWLRQKSVTLLRDHSGVTAGAAM